MNAYEPTAAPTAARINLDKKDRSIKHGRLFRVAIFGRNLPPVPTISLVELDNSPTTRSPKSNPKYTWSLTSRLVDGEYMILSFMPTLRSAPAPSSRPSAATAASGSETLRITVSDGTTTNNDTVEVPVVFED